MLWQVVRFEFAGATTQSDRRDFERDLERLAETIEDLAAVRVARSEEDRAVTAYVSIFADRAAFDRYLEHPDHQPIAAAAEALCSDIQRMLFHAGGLAPA